MDPSQLAANYLFQRAGCLEDAWIQTILETAPGDLCVVAGFGQDPHESWQDFTLLSVLTSRAAKRFDVRIRLERLA